MNPWYASLVRTWPSEKIIVENPWAYHISPGGGKRVQATRIAGAAAADSVALAGAEVRMRGFGQPLLFHVTPEDCDFDDLLEKSGYAIVDPTVIYAAPVRDIARIGDDISDVIPCWPPLAMTAKIWEEGGIGPDRQAIMQRCDLPKTTLIARIEGRAAGVAYVAVDGPRAMVHAVEVRRDMRRRGTGRRLVERAAQWALDHAVEDFGLATTRGNIAANRLYQSMGFSEVTGYHYRLKQPQE